MTKRRKPQLSAEQRIKRAAQLRQQRPLSAAERRSELGAKKALGHMSAAEHGMLVAVADAAEKYADTGPTPETRVKHRRHPLDVMLERGVITGGQHNTLQLIYEVSQHIKADVMVRLAALERVDTSRWCAVQEESAFWADMEARYKAWFNWIIQRSQNSRMGCIPDVINRICEGRTLTECAVAYNMDKRTLSPLLQEALDAF